MTPAELDWLAVVQADIRLRYDIARLHTHSWQPADPPPLPGKAAATVAGVGE